MCGGVWGWGWGGIVVALVLCFFVGCSLIAFLYDVVRSSFCLCFCCCSVSEIVRVIVLVCLYGFACTFRFLLSGIVYVIVFDLFLLSYMFCLLSPR